MTSDVFVAYVKQQLVPTLRPGDVVVMDNLSSHKRAAVRTAIEFVGRHSNCCRRTVFKPRDVLFGKLRA
jgi:hypothetical protein